MKHRIYEFVGEGEQTRLRETSESIAAQRPGICGAAWPSPQYIDGVALCVLPNGHHGKHARVEFPTDPRPFSEQAKG